MGIFIKNPEVERKARELARLTGKTLTSVVEEGLDRQLADARRVSRKGRTLEEVHEVTERFRRRSGLDQVAYRPFTKADWDALWPTGIPEIDEA
jgi:antitoxin VapB